ncbi:xanthomonalisin [Dyella jiangningensis]|uniref:protease pro-enzyme activation domain-containing protein n=1 Tax=Dyella sp. AtDHG13 TaxID=1938897 RepID=UPI000880E1E7|nr:protease pro-enzyme activation domain-containing protein [Dyella sp. AtDHG13]PXV55325.1 pseudomonalisin/xanthomonalisin [Dyella sp. AtDHG13]SDK80761.1 xanthomonalisin [Dyella jiangningensis]
MSSRIRNTHAKSILPMALALAFGPLAAHAATADWAPTRSHAALLKTVTTSPAAAGRAAVTRTSYAINRHGLPQVQSAVTPLDNTKALHVAVSLNLRNAEQLQAFIKNVNTPGNPSFGKFLTPAQFKAAYAPTDAQVQAVVAHLRKSGFTQVSVSPNNLLVFADGNASAASTAFNTTMKTYVDNGKQRFANDSDVMVPQALGGIVGSVIGLQNIEHRHPMNFLGRPVTQTAQATTQGTPVNVTHTPTEFPTIYNAGSTPTAFNTTVGIVTWGDLTQTREDLNTMTSAMAMAPVNVKVVPVTLGNLGEVDFSDDPNSDTEWNLDSQSIIGTSGGVKQLVFYTAANGKYGAADEELTDAGITAAYNQAVVDNLAKVINVSLGEDETIANQTGTQAADDAIFAQAVAQGQTFSVASGDQGVYVTTNGEFETNAGGPLAGFNPATYSVSEPATSPYVIAVGGTELTTNGGAWAGETTWNDGVQDAGDGNNRIWASTGGKSLFETAPAWQAQQLGASVRQVPDIAFDASSYTGAQIFIGGQRYTVGGTSLASPIFVGVFARVQTYANNSIGFPVSLMYRDFPGNAAVLHDVTSGNNGVSYQGKQYGYNAAAGWDFTTGYGSLDIGKFNQLAFTWGNGSPATTNPPVTPTALTNGVTVSAQGQAGASTQFMLVVPGGTTTLSFRTAGGSGDVSMYVKRGSAASASSYDYMSARPNSNTESVVVRNPTAGVYYVTLTSPGVFTGVALLGSYQ